MSRLIPYGKQDLSESDIQAVVQTLKSDWLTQGPAIESFERAVAAYCGATYAVAVSNATAALHIACLAAGLSEGDSLWTSPNSFVASANCGLYCGAQVDFVDIDPKTYNLSAKVLEEKLIEAERLGKLPKVIIPVHFSGQSCEMDRISALAKKYNITLIEDASHAIGGSYLTHKIGSCTFSDMTVFSFHPVKVITTGEGGMVLTNSKTLYELLLRLRSHGITRDPAQMMGDTQGPWYYEQVELGFNYRMTDIQASLGESQLSRLDLFVQRRHQLARQYHDMLQNLPITLPWQHPDTYSALHLFVIRLQLSKIKKSRKEVFEALRAAGIGVNVHYIPIHVQPYYKNLGFKVGDFIHAEEYYEEAISLPMYFGLSDEDQDFVIETLRRTLVS